MKRLIFILGIWLTVVACSGRNQTIFVHSYVNGYKEGDWNAVCGVEPDTKEVAIYMWLKNVTTYWSPEAYGTGEEAKKFLEIAERNGDRTYDREEVWFEVDRIQCCADNYKAIHVVCTNAAWDEAHPAGASLNDLIRIYCQTYGDFVRSGYVYRDGHSTGHILKPLAELAPDDLMMLQSGPDLIFKSHPAAGKYDMEVTLVTTEGEEQVSTCTFDFDEPKTAI